MDDVNDSHSFLTKLPDISNNRSVTIRRDIEWIRSGKRGSLFCCLYVIGYQRQLARDLENPGKIPDQLHLRPNHLYATSKGLEVLPITIAPPMIQSQKDYIAAAIGLAVLLIILTWASCDRIEKRFDRVYSDLSAQMRVIESKLDKVKESVDRLK